MVCCHSGPKKVIHPSTKKLSFFLPMSTLFSCTENWFSSEAEGRGIQESWSQNVPGLHHLHFFLLFCCGPQRDMRISCILSLYIKLRGRTVIGQSMWLLSAWLGYLLSSMTRRGGSRVIYRSSRATGSRGV